MQRAKIQKFGTQPQKMGWVIPNNMCDCMSGDDTVPYAKKMESILLFMLRI